jgi:hypothetical protein
MRSSPPEAIVIELSRAPALGHDMALAILKGTSTKHVPLIFVDGTASMKSYIKKSVPDGIFTNWAKIRSALKQAVSRPAVFPTDSSFGGSGSKSTDLPKKLGIKKDIVVAMSGASRGFELTLGLLPDGVQMTRSIQGDNDLLLWFTKTKVELEKRALLMVETAGKEGLWVFFPKKSSGVTTEITQALVVKQLKAVGAKHVKNATIGTLWSAARFTCKKKKPSQPPAEASGS